MLTIGTYVLYGIIAIFGLGVLTIVILMVLNSSKEKAVAQELSVQPKETSLADQIQEQFKADDERKERIIYNQSGITKARMKDTRSAFSFASNDSDNELTLESQFADDDFKEPFIDKKDNDNI